MHSIITLRFKRSDSHGQEKQPTQQLLRVYLYHIVIVLHGKGYK